MEGLAIPDAISDKKAKEALAKITSNDKTVVKLCQELTGVSLWSGEAKTEQANKILCLMAHNHYLLCWLRGERLDTGNKYACNLEPEDTTNGAVVNLLIFGKPKPTKGT
jgi:hypothetical protein